MRVWGKGSLVPGLWELFNNAWEEYLGWAWFLGIGMLCVSPLFSGGRLESWIRWLMLLYGGTALVSAMGFLLGNWIALLGFAAWGLVLVIITGLLTLYFRRGERNR